MEVRYLSGVYAHPAVRSHAFIFRCALPEGAAIRLSAEHSAYRYVPIEELPPVQRHRVVDCLGFRGEVRSARF